MGVYIKGMKMPESCQKCTLFNFKHERVSYFDHDRPYYKAWTCLNACVFAEDKMVEDIRKRPEWCPLVEVPTPHGRLIDADALKESIKEARKAQPEIADVYDDDYFLVAEWLASASTIIPAEEGK